MILGLLRPYPGRHHLSPLVDATFTRVAAAAQPSPCLQLGLLTSVNDTSFMLDRLAAAAGMRVGEVIAAVNGQFLLDCTYSKV